MAVKRRKAPLLLATKLEAILYGDDETMRRAQRKKRPFNDNVLARLRAANSDMCERMSYIKRGECTLTHQEVLDLVAPPEHHHFLLSGANIVRGADRESWFTIPFITREGNVQLGFLLHAMHNTPAPLIPISPLYMAERNHAAHARIASFVDYVLEVTREHTIVNECIDFVYENCASPEQARFVWPAIRSLASRALTMKSTDTEDKEYLSDFLLLTENNNPPKFSPKMDRNDRVLFQQASQYVTANLCLDNSEDIDLGKGGGLYVDMRMFELPSIDLNGIITSRVNPYK
jgi:hypothetical protein